MGLDYHPDFSLVADGKDITDAIQRNLISLTLTDNAGKESDRLAITLSLPDSVATPKKGAILRLSLGFRGELLEKGQYVVDEVTSSGPPRRVQIVANAAPMDNRKQAGSLQTQKTRSFDDITLGDLMKTVAAEHGLEPRVDRQLDSIPLVHIDQVGESDMNLMTRLAKRYGAVSKPANGFWLFLKEGEGKTASGKILKNLTIQPHHVTSWQCRFSSRNDVRKVVATYHDLKTGDIKEVSTGTGEPECRLSFKYPNYDEAKAAAIAKEKSVKAGSATLDVTLPARSDVMVLVAESHLTLSGFGDVEDGKWRLKSVEWSLSDSGFQVRLSGDRGAS